ncbi:hypothetical protein LQR31_07030 [Chromobacterium vaccinii]|uniref:hypothetical protein n=1 Tax=Chromobacterium vaccinii TaxID=1108595 RepID=UPI001E659826|nr:hypothetical protein [Chromobacterium vaccinii]MCD4484227.1 hypothetical protein [Chromobacterium vaccinii]
MLRFFQRIFTKSESSGTHLTSTTPSAQPSSPISVIYNEKGVQLHFEGEVKQSVAWGEIDMIAIRIEDEFLPFPYWYVGNQENLLRIPNDATGGKELFFDGLSKYVKGYKSDETFKAIIEASAAMEGSFVLWRTENATTT